MGSGGLEARLAAWTRAELIELVERIMSAEGKTEDEADELVGRFCDKVPHPDADELIFSPDKLFGHDPSPTEVVDRALSYEPVELGPAD
jgi:hypothetical protein